MRALGTTPPDTASEQEAARWVRGMFGEVAPRYDLLNHLLSLNIDKYWRSRTVRKVAPILDRADATVADICCGTCDLLIAMEARLKGRALGTDFCHPMLTAARGKNLRSPLFEADATRLPLPDRSLDLVTCAFGFRNLANYRAGLEEMLRVLKPGGTAAILEFSTPPNAAFAAFYNFYSRRILPRIGAMISGSRDAYTYLPESVKKFPGAEALASDMRAAGLTNVEFERMTFGIVALHVGVKP